MWIESLKVLAPPTGYKPEGWTWPRVEAAMGLKLPNDFKQIVTLYGPGVWLDWVILYVPEVANRDLALESLPQEILNGDRGFLSDLTAEQRAEEFPYRLYPEPGGLFPFAHTSGGDKLYWRTGGHPDDWPIVENDSRDTATTEFPFGIGELLVRYLRNELDAEVFPRPVPRPDKLFVRSRRIRAAQCRGTPRGCPALTPIVSGVVGYRRWQRRPGTHEGCPYVRLRQSRGTSPVQTPRLRVT